MTNTKSDLLREFKLLQVYPNFMWGNKVYNMYFIVHDVLLLLVTYKYKWNEVMLDELV